MSANRASFLASDSDNTDLPQSRGIHAAVAFVLGATSVPSLESSLVQRRLLRLRRRRQIYPLWNASVFMSDDRDSLRNPNPVGETLQLILGIVLVVVLLAACITIPLLVAAWVHPAVGALVAILAMVAWIYIGPPPMPGFLNGIVALNGLFALFAVFVVCVIRAVKLWLA